MRAINNIVIHCTATRPNATVTAIQRYWKNSMGWKQPGYHYLITDTGVVHPLQPESAPTNGVAGHNADSIHVSYIGGVDSQGVAADTRTGAQRAAMVQLLKDLHKRYPEARILGHRDFPGVKKACPSFDVAAWLKTTDILTSKQS